MGNLRKFGILVAAEEWEVSELNHQRTWVKIMYGLLTGALSKPSCCERFTQTHPPNKLTRSEGRERRKKGGREWKGGERERKREKGGGGKGRRKEEEKESAFSSWLCSNASVYLNNHSLFWTLSFPIRKMGG